MMISTLLANQSKRSNEGAKTVELTPSKRTIRSARKKSVVKKYLSTDSFTSRGLNGAKNESSIFIRLKQTLLSTEGTNSFSCFRKNLMLT